MSKYTKNNYCDIQSMSSSRIIVSGLAIGEMTYMGGNDNEVIHVLIHGEHYIWSPACSA